MIDHHREVRILYCENRTSARRFLSTILFNMVLERTIRSSKLNRDGDILHTSHQIIGYADDLAIIARIEKGLKDNIEIDRGGAEEGIAGK